MPHHPTVRILLLVALSIATVVAADVTTQHNDISRTGANLAETTLTWANVNQAGFGKLFECALDDEMYAQPLYLSALDNIAGGTHNVVYAATVNNSVYAYDADNGTLLWSRLTVDVDANNIVPLFSNMTGACGGNYKDFDSHMGIVGAGVIDRANGRLYFLARTRSPDANPDTATYYQRLHVVNIRTGAELTGSPSAPIAASMAGTGSGNVAGVISFDPRRNNQRVSILLHGNGNIYLGWSSHCDWGPYHGWFMGYNYNGTAFTQVCAMASTPNTDNGGIWMSNNGCAAEPGAGGSIFFSTGNGTYTDGGGNFADSLLKVNPATAAVLDWFTPNNEQALNAADADFGVSGPMLIPGTYNGKNLLLTTSKEGKFYVVDTATGSMGQKNGTGAGAGNDNQIIQAFQPFGGHIHGSAVFFDAGSAKYAYAWSENDFLKSFALQNTGLFNTAPAAQSAMAAPGGMPGGFLSVSANGTSNGIVWASLPWSGNANQQTQPGVLRAFNATDLTELWNSHQFPLRDDFGNFAKDSNPTIAGGKVYMATFSNKLCAYGLLPQNNTLAVLITSPANNATLTEPANLTINASASTGVGTISKVEFFVNNVKLGQDTNAPYSLAWLNVYDGTYTLAAMVTDSNGAKAMSPTTTVTVSGGAGTGSILREYWTGLTANTSIASLVTETANYTNAPSGRTSPTIFEAPTGFGDNYGTRMRGYVHPPVTGAYTFWIASDDNGQLFLSTDTNPANAVSIATVGTWTDVEAWDTMASQKSAAITLTAGQKYYIEAVQREQGGGDNLAVGWQLPGGSYERPITGGHLSPFVLAGMPTVTSVAATVGPIAGGTVVTITGVGFTGASGADFGGVAASGFTVNSDTSITCTTPAHAPGAVNVDVVVSGLMGTLVNGFTYQVPAGTPTITAVNPVFGTTAGGTSVTITGTNLAGTTGVTFGGVAATSVTPSAGSITCIAPAHAAGPVDVVVTTGSGAVTATNGFCYVPPAGTPSITSITPSTGSTNGGTAVTITGANLASATGVTFGGGTATSIVVVSATTVTCVTPAHAAGAINVVVTTASSNATATNGYTYVTPPTITSISPTSGAAGISITITGTNLSPASSVTIGGAALTITVNTPTQISATIPSGTVSGSVVVTTGGGSVTSAAVFNAPPASSSSKCGGGLFALIGLLLLTQLRRFRQGRDPA